MSGDWIGFECKLIRLGVDHSMPSATSQDEIVGSFGDICVRRSDAELFGPGQWLNDTCISAYLEFLTTEKYEDSKLLLVPGSTAYFLLHGGTLFRFKKIEKLYLDHDAVVRGSDACTQQLVWNVIVQMAYRFARIMWRFCVMSLHPCLSWDRPRPALSRAWRL